MNRFCLRIVDGAGMTRATRRGAVLLVVLVSVGIVAVVLVTIAKLTAAEQQTLRTEQWQSQAVWLAESGLERAASRLTVDPAYSGERWAIPPEQLQGRYPAAVTISIQTITGQPARRAVHVVADYPDQLPNRVRRSKQAVFDLPQGVTQR